MFPRIDVSGCRRPCRSIPSFGFRRESGPRGRLLARTLAPPFHYRDGSEGSNGLTQTTIVPGQPQYRRLPPKLRMKLRSVNIYHRSVITSISMTHASCDLRARELSAARVGRLTVRQHRSRRKPRRQWTLFCHICQRVITLWSRLNPTHARRGVWRRIFARISASSRPVAPPAHRTGARRVPLAHADRGAATLAPVQAAELAF